MAIDHRRLLTLQALRAFAALMVLVGHSIGIDATHPEYSANIIIIAHKLSILGVDVFFVISGFVMFYTTADTPASRENAQRFFLKRLIRIVPLYWLATTFYVLFLENHWDWSGLITSYLFIPHINVTNGHVQPIYKIGWTLLYEMYFYLVMSVLMLTRRRFEFLSAVFLPGLLLGCLTTFENPFMQMITDSVMIEFWFGAVAAQYVLSGNYSEKKRLWLIVAMIPLAPLVTVPVLHVKLLAVGMVTALLIVLLVGEEQAGRIKTPRLLVSIGASSYALYLIHPLAIGMCGRFWTRLVGSGHIWAELLVMMLVAVSVAHVIHELLERPVMGWLKKRLLAAPQP